MSNRTCSIDGCDGNRVARGWCRRHYTRWDRFGSTDGPADPVCKTCGGAFARRYMGGPPPSYCSEVCDPRRHTPRPWHPCAVCDALVAAARLFCSTRCQSEWWNHPTGRPKGRDCIECGVWIDFSQVRPGGRRVKADTRKCFTCRRDGRYPLTVQQLAERDGETCSLCRQPVDMSLVWPDRFAPTRDHVMPYSLGGGNEPENLALAHFTCNVSKKNRVTAATPA